MGERHYNAFQEQGMPKTRHFKNKVNGNSRGSFGRGTPVHRWELAVADKTKPVSAWCVRGGAHFGGHLAGAKGKRS